MLVRPFKDTNISNTLFVTMYIYPLFFFFMILMIRTLYRQICHLYNKVYPYVTDIKLQGTP